MVAAFFFRNFILQVIVEMDVNVMNLQHFYSNFLTLFSIVNCLINKNITRIIRFQNNFIWKSFIIYIQCDVRN